MNTTNETMAGAPAAASSLGSLSIYLKARPVIAEAVAALAADPRAPNVTSMLENYRKFAEFHPTAPPGRVLDNFMVQVSEQLKQRGLRVDALAMYTVRFKIALQLGIKE